jgi:hypothetical protein
MKFAIKTEPVYVVLVAVPAHAAITIITISMGMEAKDFLVPSLPCCNHLISIDWVHHEISITIQINRKAIKCHGRIQVTIQMM